MSLIPPKFDYTANAYLAVYLTPSSPYLADPSSISTIHPALKHIGPVGVMKDIQVVSLPKDDWGRLAEEVLVSFRDKAGIQKVEVQEEPKTRAKRAGGEL